jgi:hypothetical protein
MHQGTTVQIEHHRHVDMTLAQRELVDGDVAHFGELSLLEPGSQGGLVEVLDQIPAHPEQSRYMLDGGELAELHHMPGKGLEMPRLAASKLDGLAGHLSAALAAKAMTVQHHHLLASANRKGEKRTLEAATVDEFMPPRSTGSTPFAVPIEFHMMVDPTFPVLRGKMPVATKPQRVVQKTRRCHGRLLRPNSKPDRGSTPWRRPRNPEPTL